MNVGKLAPAMVEVVLSAHRAVAAAAVVGVSDPRYGQQPFTVYCLRPGSADPGAEGLREWATARTRRAVDPRPAAIIDRWLVTVQGKLDRSLLTRRDA